MTTRFAMKYVKQLKDGSYKYRRLVPKPLQTVLGKKEFSRHLGRTEEEALKAYPAVHEHFERVVANVPAETGAAEIEALKQQINAQFEELGLRRHWAKSGWNEQAAREEEADRILAKYPIDEETGNPDPDDVSLADRLMVTALLESPAAIEVTYTISDVFSHYIEHWKRDQDDEGKIKRYEDRVRRMQRHLLSIVGSDIPITELTRDHARKLRDRLREQPSQSGDGKAAYGTVKRNFNTTKAAINHGIKELDIVMVNPLNGIELGKPPINARDLKHSLPPEVIAAMYRELSNNQVLLDVWTLMHHTGAQNAEILGLRSDDVYLNDPVPHFEIRPREGRSVKEGVRIRKLPLVGKAHDTMRRLIENTAHGEYLFGKIWPDRQTLEF
ncbi:hypothetical protein KDD17_14435 [Sulfitobacter albidus]|uniref:Core-binding (CB) domain-containing protein n=1 Tax=Sulfitobacter albidus TaxID=2829501 RepID=A0A975JD77_9RHOB|nr:site-specific integrase [Sulfitobacter albidus]QUJ76105.1 hypothetical protein KDD17_14435 [Sulfitobacter albidus]